MNDVYVTKEYRHVTWYHMVYEIRWERLNQETSIAYPHRLQAYQVPEGYPFWKSESNCQNECDKLNATNPTYKPGKPKELNP